MIKPINNFILIEPIPDMSFMGDGGKFQEIGRVLDCGEFKQLENKRVYFDAWLPKKYRVPGSSHADEKFYWLINYEDICAYDDETLPPEQPVQK